MLQCEPIGVHGLAPWLRGDPETWGPQTLARDVLYGEAGRLAADGRAFERARRLAAEVLAFKAGVQVARRVVHDTPMYLLLVSCMHLHHRRDPAVPTSGITLTGLRELLSPDRTARRFAGDSHLREMMAWVRQCDLLRLLPASDGRVRLYAPTPLLEDMFRRWAHSFLRTDAWDRGHDPEGVPLPSAQLVYHVLSWRIQAFRHGFVPTERFPLIQQHMLRRHGYATFLAMVQAMEPTGDGGATAQFPLSAVAASFQVARGTVRAVLGIGAEAGLLEHDSRRSRLHLAPAFVQLATGWMALEFVYMRDLCRHAAARLAMQETCVPPATAPC